jgi:CRP/FNR family transcriptional regulator
MIKMNTANHTHKTCSHCHFTAFCRPGGQAHDAPGFAVKKHHHLKKNEVLCHSNHKFNSLYAIQEGVLKSYQVEANGKELVRGFYFAGEIFGYEAIYNHQYQYSAVALTDTLLCEIPYTYFLESLQVKPSLQKHILQLLSQQLTIGSYLISSTAEQRVAAFLIDLSERLHPINHHHFLLPMSRYDIGNYLRLTGETISRIFSRLQQSNIINIDNKKIHLAQIDKLQQIAAGL